MKNSAWPNKRGKSRGLFGNAEITLKAELI